MAMENNNNVNNDNHDGDECGDDNTTLSLL